MLIALGSNVGERERHLDEAVEALRSAVRIELRSCYYETEPMYVADQRSFINAAVSGDTGLSPRDLLQFLKSIEALVGRQARARYGPREVDLDLIAYGTLTYRYVSGGETKLSIPHPKAAERRFVLEPLAEIVPDTVIPGFGRVAELLKQTNDQSGSVVKVRDAVLHL